MLKFPLLFNAQASAKSGISTHWNASAEKLPNIISAIPPEFGGPGQGYSPEEFFALSVLNCLIATFKVYCEKSNLQFSEIQGKAVLSLNKHPSDSVFWLSDIEITLEVTGASNVEKVKTILDKSIRDCAVSNSIKSAKTFHLKVS